MPKPPPTGISGEGHPPYEEEFRVIGHILEKDAAQIMGRWFERATEEQVHADADHRKEAMDELLKMLQSLGRRLYQQSDHAMEVAGQFAREHGEQRFDLKWNIVDLVRDYEILHGVVLEHLGRMLNERLTYRQAMIIATIMARATGQAVYSYSAMTSQQLEQQAGQLRRLAAQLNTAEQRLRRQLAQALHDHLQQLLVSARMKVEWTARRADPEAAEPLAQVQQTLDQALQWSRILTAELYPPVLYDRGLGPALEWLGNHVREQHGLRVQVRTDPAAEPDDQDLQAFLFSAVQELLLNVVKHAKTDQAQVTMQQQGSNVLITVEDRGVGCVPDEVVHPSEMESFGIFNIRERLRLMGGSMNVETGPDQGCRVEISCPLGLARRGDRSPSRERGARGVVNSSLPIETKQAQGTPPRKRIRVMIVDDHKIMREGLRGILGHLQSIEIVAEAADGREAVDLIDEASPDVVIMDMAMPRMDGIEATKWITKNRPDIRVVGLSMHNSKGIGDAMVEAGASAYLAKGGPSSDLVDAIHRAARGTGSG